MKDYDIVKFACFLFISFARFASSQRKHKQTCIEFTYAFTYVLIQLTTKSGQNEN